jgi:hypothetical protein
MIALLHVPESVAIATARALVTALGPDDQLAVRWINAVRRLGYIYRPDLPQAGFFSKPV